VVTTTLDTPAVSPLWDGLRVYSADELTLDDYHRDIVPGGSLSSSGARKLLDPGCPAQFDYDRKHPQPVKKEFDLGTAAHTLILGNGADLVEVPAKRWDSIPVKAEVRAIRDAGKIPLKTHELEQVHAMAAALLRHPTAAAIFDPAAGVPEQSLYWRDPITGVTCRARPDWLPNPGPGRAIIPDYKTAVKVDRKSIQKAIRDRAYHQQAAWCVEGARHVGIADEHAVFLLVFQAKNPPYHVVVVQVDALDLRIGHAKNAVARDIYRECNETGVWPAYGEGVEIISQPEWDQKQQAEEYL
jgi:hypothetical protein